jgi:hypothetical protein
VSEKVIGAIKDKMNERNQKAVEFAEFVKNEKAAITKFKDVKDVNTKLGEILANKQQMPNGVLTQVKYALFNKAKSLGCTYDDKKSKFVKKKEAAPKKEEEAKAES